MKRSEYAKLLTELSADLKSSVENIKQELSNAKSLYTRTKSYVENAQSIVDKITNEETGLDAVLTQSVSLKSDIEANRDTSVTIFKEISKLKDTASGYTTDLKKMSETAKQTIGKITENHKESEDLKNKINSIWNISSQRLHANYFDARQKFLAKTAITWLVLFVVMFVLTLVLGDKYITPLVKIIESGEKEITQVVTFETLLIRLGLVTPSILATIYCLNQFSHERRLHEQYAFKAVSMLSVESSIELLIRSLSRNDKATDKDNRIVSFAVTTLESIYKDPIDSTKHSWLFRGGNKLLEMSVEMNESMGEIKSDIDQIKDITLKNKT